LVWGTDGRSVRDVLVAGHPVVLDGRCVNVDTESVNSAAQEAQGALLTRAGIDVPHRWPQRDCR
jgi:5-methylthioadenosine/S-adenosylhomocysteine deaminase